MRVILSALTFDPLGVVALATLPGQQFGETRRRMNRIATLDGGAVFNDSGFSEADRSIRLDWRTTPALHESVDRLAQLYGSAHLATPRGFYLVAIEAYVPGLTLSTLSLLVAKKLA